MTAEKMIEVSQKIEAKANELYQLMIDEGLSNHISMTIQRNGFIAIQFENCETTKAGKEANYVTTCTSVLSR